MTEFVELKANIYAYRKLDKKLMDKCRNGSNKCVITKILSFDDSKTCLLDHKTIYTEQMLFNNRKYEVYK